VNMKEQAKSDSCPTGQDIWEVEALPLLGWKGDNGSEEETTRYSMLNCLINEFDNEV
jgi:hypothetical protein